MEANPETVKRPTAVGAPGTIVRQELPPPEVDGYLKAVVDDAEAAGCSYNIVVRNPGDEREVLEMLVPSDVEKSVRVNESLGVRAVWRKKK